MFTWLNIENSICVQYLMRMKHLTLLQLGKCSLFFFVHFLAIGVTHDSFLYFTFRNRK